MYKLSVLNCSIRNNLDYLIVSGGWWRVKLILKYVDMLEVKGGVDQQPVNWSSAMNIRVDLLLRPAVKLTDLLVAKSGSRNFIGSAKPSTGRAGQSTDHTVNTQNLFYMQNLLSDWYCMESVLLSVLTFCFPQTPFHLSPAREKHKNIGFGFNIAPMDDGKVSSNMGYGATDITDITERYQYWG